MSHSVCVFNVVSRRIDGIGTFDNENGAVLICPRSKHRRSTVFRNLLLESESWARWQQKQRARTAVWVNQTHFRSALQLAITCHMTKIPTSIEWISIHLTKLVSLRRRCSAAISRCWRVVCEEIQYHCEHNRTVVWLRRLCVSFLAPWPVPPNGHSVDRAFRVRAKSWVSGVFIMWVENPPALIG